MEDAAVHEIEMVARQFAGRLGVQHRRAGLVVEAGVAAAALRRAAQLDRMLDHGRGVVLLDADRDRRGRGGQAIGLPLHLRPVVREAHRLQLVPEVLQAGGGVEVGRERRARPLHHLPALGLQYQLQRLRLVADLRLAADLLQVVAAEAEQHRVELLQRRLVEGGDQRDRQYENGRVLVGLGESRMGVLRGGGADDQRVFLAVLRGQPDGQVRRIQAVFGRVLRLERLVRLHRRPRRSQQ